MKAQSPHPRNRTAARAAAAALAALAAAAPGAALAQEGGALTLGEVVRRTLDGSPTIQLARARLDAGRGELLSSAAPFDLQVGAGVAGERQNRLEPDAQTGLLERLSLRSTRYSVGAARQTRSGITVSPQLSVSRTAYDGAPVADATASVGLDVTVPLLRDRWGRATAAPERAARVALRADELDVRHGIAGGVFDAAAAYWEYAAAHERLGVYTRAEERARTRLERTRTLVAADERPASDLHPLEASLARARMSRISAEQGVEETRRRLGLAMGVEPAEIAALAAPATAFPTAAPWLPDDAEERRLVALAVSRRADLAAGTLDRRSVEILVDGARSELQPRLDLQVGVGYSGRQMSSGYGGLVEPLFQDVPGLNATFGLRYAFPVGNAAARGLALQRQAAGEQQRIAERSLAREIESGVRVAVAALRRRAAEVAEAERAVELYRTTVENEQTKSGLGAATVFDVIFAEDNLTAALLNVVAGRQGYAVALAQLRYETGTMVEDGEAGPTVETAKLLERP